MTENTTNNRILGGWLPSNAVTDSDQMWHWFYSHTNVSACGRLTREVNGQERRLYRRLRGWGCPQCLASQRASSDTQIRESMAQEDWDRRLVIGGADLDDFREHVLETASGDLVDAVGPAVAKALMDWLATHGDANSCEACGDILEASELTEYLRGRLCRDCELGFTMRDETSDDFDPDLD